MSTGIRLVAEHYDIKTNKILQSNIIADEQLTKANTLRYLGYTHVEQIKIIQAIQDFKIAPQILLNCPIICPDCNNKLLRNGPTKSPFYSVLTDHTVVIPRLFCKCGWRFKASIENLFGSNVHPDLLKKQAIQGSKESYNKASASLDAESAATRKINNHTQIMRAVEQVANTITPLKIAATAVACYPELIAHIDGGHIKSIGENRSFEAMIATVYRPESLITVNKNQNEIIDKTTVASAKDDLQETMKQLFVGACVTQGMSIKSIVTCLADGADNCREIANAIKQHCNEVVYILDWFHIAKRFQNIAIPPEHKEKYKHIKFNLWHGNVVKALQRLAEFMQISDIVKNSITTDKLKKLSVYISNNELGIVNYAVRKKAGLVFTSNLAECTVNTVINERQKGKKKMLWSRQGAHNILQIRSSVFSKSWDDDWMKVENELYLLAA